MAMAIEKPSRGVGRTEQIGLDAAATHVLDECRMVLPGIQALFGFQLIAVFNDGFSEKLPQGGQILHLAAIVLVAIAIALIMTPAALHRHTSQREVSERFVWLSSALLLASMFPLLVGLCLELYLIGEIILDSPVLAAAIAAVLFAIFILLWIALPLRERLRHR
jgi:hypothetical protein